MNKSQRWVCILFPCMALLLVFAFMVGCGPATEEIVPFVLDQVIISGPESRVDAAIIRLGTDLGESLERLNLQDAGIEPSECDTIKDHLKKLAGCLEGDEPWVLDLRQTSSPGPSGVITIVQKIRSEFPCVFADPNYVIGDPWTGVGSPWTGVGSSGLGAGAAPALQAEFEQQWAFQNIGLTNQVDVTGEGIRIGVFDTSPYDLEEEPGRAVEHIDWVTNPFTLTVWHREFLATLPAPAETTQITIPLSNHGLFVAGLAHQVAPDSEIHLYRVLDEYLQGDLFTMDAAILNFITETPAASDGLQRAVINLSLGIHPGVDQEGLDLPPEVMALELLLAGARCQGMAVIAAAGNDRAPDDGEAPPSHIPARYEFVLGVAASNFDRKPSCFSNQGQVAAPGGDGEKGCNPCSPGNCAKLSLVSLVLDPPRYAYWSGTSFAAPLASGQAALLLSSGVDPIGVHDVITGTARTIPGEEDVVRYGIIDIQSSLP